MPIVNISGNVNFKYTGKCIQNKRIDHEEVAYVVIEGFQSRRLFEKKNQF